MIQVTAALDAGSVQRWSAKTVAALEDGMMRAYRIGAERVKAEVRAMTLAAGFSQRLANSWRGNVYPQGGTKSLSPAAWVFTKAPKIMAAFEEGATIRPVRGAKFLWIPTSAVPRSGRGNRRMRPAEVEARFGAFRFAPVRGKRGSFVAAVESSASLSGRIARATRTARRAGRVAWTIMFILVRQVKLPKRLDLAGVRDRARREWPAIVDRSLVDAVRQARGR